eukprot:TRINITY_DN18132_c0_g2_i2.p1 TRINITY_DN18132_c0_g2~~TRINITY_DN18132_c0_g2_i2.p1  ORF type:complete len:203 (-),score=47.88 TRINITY_DN18132_c0_g2_i2:216-824(-)
MSVLYKLLTKIGDSLLLCFFFFFQAEDGIRDAQESRGLGDVYKRQAGSGATNPLRDELMGNGSQPSTPQRSTPASTPSSTPRQHGQRTPQVDDTYRDVEQASAQTNLELQQGLMHAAEQLKMVGLMREAEEVEGLLEAMTSGHLTTEQIQRRAQQLSTALVQSPVSEVPPPRGWHPPPMQSPRHHMPGPHPMQSPLRPAHLM